MHKSHEMHKTETSLSFLLHRRLTMRLLAFTWRSLTFPCVLRKFEVEERLVSYIGDGEQHSPVSCGTLTTTYIERKAAAAM